MRDKRLAKIKKWILLSVISVGLVCMAVNYLKSQKPDEKGGGGIWSFLGAAATRQIQKTYFLLPAYLEEGEEGGNPVRLAQEDAHLFLRHGIRRPGTDRGREHGGNYHEAGGDGRGQ